MGAFAPSLLDTSIGCHGNLPQALFSPEKAERERQKINRKQTIVLHCEVFTCFFALLFSLLKHFYPKYT